MTDVGFVGAGKMGTPMVERLVAAGHRVVVHARRAEAREQLALLGAVAVADVGEAVEDADVVLACLFSDEQLAEAGPEIARAMPPGAVLASHVTGTAGTLSRLGADVPGWADRIVDAPVSGTETEIREGRLTVLLGGAEDAVDRVHGVVASYADPILRTGGFGSALAMKLVNNLLLAVNSQTMAEALTLGSRLGLEPRTVLAALEHCSGGSQASSEALRRPDLAAHATGMARYLAKDVAACTAAAAELGVDVPRLLLDVVERGPMPLSATPPRPIS